MIVIPIIILLAMIIAKSQKGLFAAFLVVVTTKSVIDAFWDFKFGPLSVMAIQGGLIPILFYKIYRKRKILPKLWLRPAKIYAIALSLGIIWSVASRPIQSLELVVLNINIFLGFALIPILVTNRKQFEQLLIAIMICGIFPILISIYQLQTGIVFRERETAGLTRYVGLYHDAFPTRFYGLMTLLSILLHQTIFRTENLFFKFFQIALAGGAFVSIYAVFSKAAVGVLGLWMMLILMVSKSRVKQLISIIIGLGVVFIVFGDAFFGNIETLFSKEVGYQTGEVKDARYTLAGRGYIWEENLDFWINKQTFFFQWFGDGWSRATHNEYLRILMQNGILGLLFFIVFLINISSLTLRINSKLRVFGFMLLGMYFIDSIGLSPASYYYYNILVWGIFGLLLLKPQFFIKQQNN